MCVFVSVEILSSFIVDLLANYSFIKNIKQVKRLEFNFIIN